MNIQKAGTGILELIAHKKKVDLFELSMSEIHIQTSNHQKTTVRTAECGRAFTGSLL